MSLILIICFLTAYPVFADTEDSILENPFPGGIAVEKATGMEALESGELQTELNCAIIATKIFNIVNNRRVAAGKATLTRTAILNQRAKLHSDWMASNNILQHGHLVGINAQNIATMCSGNVYFDCNGGLHTVPNTNQGIATYTMHAFMAHDQCHNNGHRKTILSSAYTRIGVGVTYGHGYYWVTQDFKV